MNKAKSIENVPANVVIRRQKAKAYRDKRREHYRKLNNSWIANNRDRYNSSKARYRLKLKLEVFSLYSEKIACGICGFSNVDALVLDHINEDGAKHRKELGISQRGSNSGQTMYEYIRAHGKINGLQLLCSNCNTIKHIRHKRRQSIKDEKILREVEAMYGY